MATLLSDLFTESQGATTLLSDTFTGTDGTLLSAHTMDTGAGWTAQVNNWKIASNRATGNSAGSECIVTADAGSAQVEVSADVRFAAGSQECGIIGRFQDSSNYLLYRLNTSGSWELYHVNGGAGQLKASANTTVNLNQTYNLKARFDHGRITLFIDGVQVGVFTQADFLTSATLCGLRTFSATANTTVDNFLATSRPFTLLSAHTMDTGSGWTATPNNWLTTLENYAVMNTSPGGSTECIVVADSGVATVTISADLKFEVVTGGAAIAAGLIGRYQDGSNYWLLHTDALNSQILIALKSAGSFSTKDTAVFTFVAGTTYVVSFDLAGNVLTGSINGVAKVTTTDATLNTATKAGLRGISQAASTVDNFLVTGTPSQQGGGTNGGGGGDSISTVARDGKSY